MSYLSMERQLANQILIVNLSHYACKVKKDSS